MRAESRARVLPLIVLAYLALAGCAGTGAPKGWLPTPDQAPTDPFGAWVSATCVEPHQDHGVAGEFLAVDEDSLYVLTRVTAPGDPVIAIPLAWLKKVKIAHCDPQTGKAVGWVTTGAVSTLSHGLGLAISAPAWIILGSVITAGQSGTALAYYPDQSWDELKRFARFPQGPPSGLHELGLQPRQYTEPPPPPEANPR